MPVDERHDTAHLAAALGLPLLLVTTDGLGVLSHTLAAIAAARAHRLPVAGVILSRHSVDPLDPSTSSNRRILGERLPDTPVLPFPRCADDDEALATAAESWGLLELLPA